MRRDITDKLLGWVNSEHRKPLILEGARQVGKTTILERLGETKFQNCAYFNFEEDERLSEFFSSSLNPQRVIELLSLHSGIDIRVGDTLIIFDEIQACPRALTSLKYFCEKAREYHLVAAGSLLGIKTTQSSGFPVGKVNFLQMYPLSFFEFLEATGHERYRKFLEEYQGLDPLTPVIHDNLVDLLKTYFVVGGMPEAVVRYISNNKLQEAREVQYDILASYERDFSRHVPENQLMKVMTIWDQLTTQLAKENKKFVFSAIKKSARGAHYEEAIQWLIDAGIIYKINHVHSALLPLTRYIDHNIFKVYMLDVGLLAAKSKLPIKAIVEGDRLFTDFKGALTENYVAQELTAAKKGDLYYWSSEGKAELDYVIEYQQKIYPLEVKSGIDRRKKSLKVFGDKYPHTALSRTTLMNLILNGSICNYPLYMISRFPMQ